MQFLILSLSFLTFTAHAADPVSAQKLWEDFRKDCEQNPTKNLMVDCEVHHEFWQRAEERKLMEMDETFTVKATVPENKGEVTPSTDKITESKNGECPSYAKVEEIIEFRDSIACNVARRFYQLSSFCAAAASSIHKGGDHGLYNVYIRVGKKPSEFRRGCPTAKVD